MFVYSICHWRRIVRIILVVWTLEVLFWVIGGGGLGVLISWVGYPFFTPTSLYFDIHLVGLRLQNMTIVDTSKDNYIYTHPIKELSSTDVVICELL